MLLKCSSVQNLLSDYLDGILSEKQTNLISLHLSHCQICQRELQSLKATVDLLNFYVEKSPPDGYFEEVWPELQAKVEERTTQQSLQGIATLLGLKLNGLKAGFLYQYEKLQGSWASFIGVSEGKGDKRKGRQWRPFLLKFAVVTCLILIGIFVDRAFRPTADEIILERLKESFYSDNQYSVRFASQKANNSRMLLSKISDGSHPLNETNLIKAVEFIDSAGGILDNPPVFRWQIGGIEVDMRPIDLNGDKLTLVGNLDFSKLTDDGDTPTQKLPLVAHLSDFKPMTDSNLSSPRDLDLPEIPNITGESKRTSRFNILLDVTPNLSSVEVYDLEKFGDKK